jgi:hypothetical protein
MPVVEWAVVPVVGWIYVAGGEFLCQSHCEHEEEACLREASDFSRLTAADNSPS